LTPSSSHSGVGHSGPSEEVVSNLSKKIQEMTMDFTFGMDSDKEFIENEKVLDKHTRQAMNFILLLDNTGLGAIECFGTNFGWDKSTRGTETVVVA